MTAMLKKEWLEQMRSGKLTVLAILFVLLGIMNPAIAKLTPWLLEVMADTLAESGMTITEVSVDAMTSWTQFFKNIPMGLLAFLLMQSSIFTKEYRSETLIPIVTKGLARYKILLAKASVLTVLWTACYWLCYAVTYCYNAFFWDNSVTNCLIVAALNWYFAGLLIVVLLVFFSALAESNTAVLLGTGGTCLAAYLLGMFPQLKPYSPSNLLDSASLLNGICAPSDYRKTWIVAGIAGIALLAVSIPTFNRRRL